MRKLSLKELNRKSLLEFRESEKLPVTIVLDNVRSGLNVGSIFRTADAFAVEKIMLCGITAQPPHREIMKTAIGATESVDWEDGGETVECLQSLKEKGFHILAIEQTNKSVLLNDLELSANKKYAVVFGNEVNGIGNAALKLADQSLEIPQFGTKHSLNISVCAGIVIWELFRKLETAVK